MSAESAAQMSTSSTGPFGLLPPEQARAEGGIVTVTRVWPEKPDRSGSASGRARAARLGVEAVDAAGRLRAGWHRPGEAADADADTGTGTGTGTGTDTDGLVLFPAGTDPKLPRLAELTGASSAAAVISHRPQRRAVVRLGRGPQEATSFVKLVRQGRAQGILDGVARASSFAGPFRMPRVMEHDDSSVTFAALAGESLHEPAEQTQQDWPRAWDEVLAAWGEAVRAGNRAGAPDLPVHGAAEEAAVLRRWTEQVLPLLRAAGEDQELFVEAVEAAVVALRELPEGTPLPAHRDLHDKQVLWSAQDGPGLLDVDTACLADPALDLGNLRAHALWRRRQGIWTAEQAETVRLRVDAAAESLSRRLDHPVAESVATYERASLLRLLAVYAFRPRYAGLAAQMRGELRPAV